MKPKTNNSGLIDNQPTNTGLKQKPKEYVAPMRQTKTNVAESKKSATPKELEWEKDFDKRWTRKSKGLKDKGKYRDGWFVIHETISREVKQFINETLTKQRTELLEEIPKKIKGKNKEFVEGYNNCLDDISNLLKKL